MYGYLTFDLSRPATPWTAFYFSMPGAEVPNPEVERRRKMQASILVKAECRNLNDEQKIRLGDQIHGALKFLPTKMQDIGFEMYAALAHFRLDPAVQVERTTRIQTLLEPDFTRSPLGDVQVHGKQLEATAVMVPDAAINVTLRSQIIRLYLGLASTIYPPGFSNPVEAFHKQVCEKSGWDVTSPLVSALHACHYGRFISERDECLKTIIKQLDEKKLQDWLPQLIAGLAAREPDLLEADLSDAVFSALQASVSQEDQSIDDLVAYEVEKFVTRRSARAMQIVAATQAAIEANIPFDAVTTQKNAAALAAYDREVSRAALAMTVGRLRKTFAQPQRAAAPRQPTAAPPDLDPIHARSVEWLVQWIQGSDAKSGKSVRIDRSKVVKEEQATRARARNVTQMSDNDKAKDQDLTEKDVDLVVQSGLCSTAEFFLGDIQDMAVRAKHLDIDRHLLDACMQLTDPLNALSKQATTDETHAIALLSRAEEAIKELRAAIKSVDVAVSVRRRFTRVLDEALSLEPVVYGKRHGGVVLCPMRDNAWPWVHGEFHQRWLNVQRLEMDGRQVPLQPHQALALYVTGSSLSNYAFDVSVHLWIRKEGCKSPPTAGNSAWMNTEEWLDTRIPCAVLHVPSAG